MRGISFDVVARRDDTLLIIKILSNVDAFSKENAEEMLTLGEALGASPLLVGERSGSGVRRACLFTVRGAHYLLTTLIDHLLEGARSLFAAPGDCTSS